MQFSMVRGAGSSTRRRTGFMCSALCSSGYSTDHDKKISIRSAERRCEIRACLSRQAVRGEDWRRYSRRWLVAQEHLRKISTVLSFWVSLLNRPGRGPAVDRLCQHLSLDTQKI